jgi:hypothetical protein
MFAADIATNILMSIPTHIPMSILMTDTPTLMHTIIPIPMTMRILILMIICMNMATSIITATLPWMSCWH